MKVTVIGSHLCPDTLYALNQLAAAGVEASFKDILSCHADLMAYLNLRETSDVYAEIRGKERLGVPCFICEDETVTLDLNEILNK
ncbi:MAG: glutaredoxin [Lachnospiraceae bacterium]|nr:glutaredoxin [Lachnospiraceae bacterium]